MATENYVTFNLYRYQILPLRQDLFSAEIRARKNELFAETLRRLEHLEYGYADVQHRIAMASDNLFIMQIGVNRDLTRTTPDFSEETIENWPFVNILINNDPEIQKIAIQLNRKAFSSTSTVARLLEKNIGRRLQSEGLAIHVEAITESSAFWEIVHKYPKEIHRVEFDIVSPNLADLSRSLSEDLKDLSKNSNAQRVDLDLRSDKEAYLTLDEEDDQLHGLVDYASGGGGNIKISVKGLRKKISTRDRTVQFELDEVQIDALAAPDVRHATEMLRGLLE